MSPPSGAIPQNPSPSVKTILDCIEGFCVGNTKIFENALDDAYIHETLPKSMGIPTQTKQQYLERVERSMLLLKDFHMVYHEVIEAPGKIIVHGSNDGVSKSGRPYTNEYNFIFTIAESGEKWKITHIKEFVDSKYSLAFFAQERELQKQG